MQPTFEALQCLATIVKALESAKTLSATKLKRTYGFDDAIFEDAVEYGAERKIIKVGRAQSVLVRGALRLMKLITKSDIPAGTIEIDYA